MLLDNDIIVKLKIIISELHEKDIGEISDTQDLFATHIFDSLTIIRFIKKIEEVFNLKFAVNVLIPQNLSNLRSISAIIKQAG